MFSLNNETLTKIHTKLLDGVDSQEHCNRESFDSVMGTRDEASHEAEEALTFLGWNGPLTQHFC